MKSAEDIRNFFQKSTLSTNPERHEAVFEKIQRAQDQSKTTPALSGSNLRSKIMKSPVTKFGAVATVIITCTVGLSLWRNTGSGIALADVLARIEQVKAVRYETTFKVFGSKDPNELWANERWIMLTSQEYGRISTSVERDPNGEDITGTIQYYYPQKGLEIRNNNTKKTYTRRVTDSQTQHEPSQSQKDIITYFKDILNTKHKSIGRSIMDGIEVEGFQTVDPNYRGRSPRFLHTIDQQYNTKLWVDVKTLLPVRIEYLASEIDSPDENTRVFLQQVNYNFQWDIPVDASTFEAPPIPDGYTIKDEFPEPANEENAIVGLKQCVELLGNYPEKIDLAFLWAESEKSETAVALRLNEDLQGLTGFERDNKKMDILKPIRFLNKFYVGLAEKDSTYYGKTVTPKDKDKVLMRWKVSDGEYRVIYGDLRAETVYTEELADIDQQ